MSIQITISNILDIVTNVPLEGVFYGNTMGLLGNNNGDNADDFRPRNDSSHPLDKTSSEKDIYNKFGLTWRVQNQTVSLFNYTISGSTYSYFNNDGIGPNKFISDTISNNTIEGYINKTCGYGTINITSCGGNAACVVDAAATCNATFGLNSKATEEIAVKEKKTLDHRPPDFKQPNPLYVGYSQNSSRTFTFDFTADLKINSSGAVSDCTKCTSYSWNVTDALRVSPAYLIITATDDMNATSEYRPDIYYCGCMEGSQCDFSLIIQDGPVEGSDGKFFRARCNCSEEREGKYCENKIDRCIGTCYEGVTCNSSIPAPVNPCGPCPEGFESDGTRCYDKNECYLGTSKCSQICENTDGSYKCACENGYLLGSDNYTCNDINECEVVSHPCKDNEYCENTVGGYDCKCNPGYSNDTSKPGCVKGEASYGGILVFETVIGDKEIIKTFIMKFLTGIYKESKTINVTYIEVVSVVEFGAATRKRRATGSVKYKSDFVLHTNLGFQTADVHKVLSDKLEREPSNDDGYVAVDGAPILMSVSESVVFTDDEGGVCMVPGKTNCDPISTTCQSVNGKVTCKCRTPYFDGWANPYTSCKDVDECQNKEEICQGGTCVNFPGNYTCNCPAGYLYDGKTSCKDMCSPNPCQNGGQCIHGERQGQFLCKCDDLWAGPKCEDKNAEAEKLKIIAIAVGASIGAICLLLLLALFGMYRRHKNRYSGYRRRPLSTLDFDSSLGFSNVRTKDFPIDDDTDTTYSIPRPKFQQNGYELTESGGASNDRIETGEAGKLEEPRKRLTEETSESSGSGQDNPSFLHSDTLEAARRESKRESKNAYDYF